MEALLIHTSLKFSSENRYPQIPEISRFILQQWKKMLINTGEQFVYRHVIQ